MEFVVGQAFKVASPEELTGSLLQVGRQRLGEWPDLCQVPGLGESIDLQGWAFCLRVGRLWASDVKNLLHAPDDCQRGRHGPPVGGGEHDPKSLDGGGCSQAEERLILSAGPRAEARDGRLAVPVEDCTRGWLEILPISSRRRMSSSCSPSSFMSSM